MARRATEKNDMVEMGDLQGYRSLSRRLTQGRNAAAKAQRYWTFSRHDWERFCDDAEGADVHVLGLLQDMRIHILDRSMDGDIHLG